MRRDSTQARGQHAGSLFSAARGSVVPLERHVIPVHTRNRGQAAVERASLNSSGTSLIAQSEAGAIRRWPKTANYAVLAPHRCQGVR